MSARLHNFRHLHIAGLEFVFALIAIVFARMTTRILSSTFFNTLEVFVTSLVFFSNNIGMTEVLALVTTL
jgi:hypothetical protein